MPEFVNKASKSNKVNMSEPSTPTSTGSSRVRFIDHLHEICLLENHYDLRAKHDRNHHRTSAFIEYRITPMGFIQRWKHRKYMKEVRKRNLELQRETGQHTGSSGSSVSSTRSFGDRMMGR